ncbi:MAG: nuclear transport factor 2 family protein [Deltaproteobacteria bacterium]|nr:nuclear transport factor 2 family protein [Deltaproteobacteria bacterium]
MTTFGKEFYDRQLAFLDKKETDALVDSQYTEDAELLSHDFQIRGREALKKHFAGYLDHLGYIKLISTDKFTELDDAIFFEATVEVKAGLEKGATVRVYDIFEFSNGKARRHYTGLLSFTPNT